MRLDQTPRPDQTIKVSTKLVTSSTILHLSSDELERTVNQEQAENPLLEVAEQRICLFCGTPAYGQLCSACGHPIHTANAVPAGSLPTSFETHKFEHFQQHNTFDSDNYGFVDGEEEEYDPLSRLPVQISLVETLYIQLVALIAREDEPIAEQLIGNLNEHGYLDISPQEIALNLHVPLERVEKVLTHLQNLEPVGIGARNARECLLLQLHALYEPDPPPTLLYNLIDRHLNALGQSQFQEIARQLQVKEEEVRQASCFIRHTFYPWPAHLYHTNGFTTFPHNHATYIHPDIIIIRRGQYEYEVELIEERRYHFSISTNKSDTIPWVGTHETGRDIQQYLRHQRERARFFVDCVYRRWRTLKRVAQYIVKVQVEFLEKGCRYLKPLTRAEVAQQLQIDEGTVSRATANKYVLLPDGRLQPLAIFFDSSMSIKDLLCEIIRTEDPKHRLSDEELTRLLTKQGIRLARRTVTKYREELGIGSSRERGLRLH